MNDERMPGNDFTYGDAVRVKPEGRRRYVAGTRAATGATMEVLGPNGCAVAIGFKFSDYAHEWELESVPTAVNRKSKRSARKASRRDRRRKRQALSLLRE